MLDHSLLVIGDVNIFVYSLRFSYMYIVMYFDHIQPISLLQLLLGLPHISLLTLCPIFKPMESNWSLHRHMNVVLSNGMECEQPIRLQPKYP